MLFMSSQITFLFELMHFLYMCQGKVTYLKVYMMYYKNILSSEIYHILLQINHIVFLAVPKYYKIIAPYPYLSNFWHSTHIKFKEVISRKKTLEDLQKACNCD